MKIRAFALTACLVLSAVPAVAEQVTLAGDELRQAVTGKTVYLKVSGFDLPIRYGPNGHMSGRINAVAASFSRGDGTSDTGKWWVDNDQLCQKWSSWLESKAYCFKLTRDGNSVHWVRDDGLSGTARISG
jgi:hypothetical protein